MPLHHAYADATLSSQQTLLLKLADEYCEMSNPHVVHPSEWVRPLIADFMAIVKERHAVIAANAENGYVIDEDVVHAADRFFDEVIELIVAAYPMTASYSVRGITSKIRNDVAIARLDTRASLDKLQQKSPPAHYAGVLDEFRQQKISCGKLQQSCEQHPEIRDALYGLTFSTGLFHRIAVQCCAKRAVISQEGDVTMKRETHFAAFRRYWQSFPYGDACLALAIKKLLHADKLMKRIIRSRSDVADLLLLFCPTVETRKQTLQQLMKNNYLSLKMLTTLFELFPEGAQLNWRVDFAEFGIQHYLSLTHPDTWEHSKQKRRAEAYAGLCQQYHFETVLVKKIIIYALLNSEGLNLQRWVCRAMGFSRVEAAKKLFYDSIKHDADISKINFSELEHVIADIVSKANAGKTLADEGAYQSIFSQLQTFAPTLVATKSMF